MPQESVPKSQRVPATQLVLPQVVWQVVPPTQVWPVPQGAVGQLATQVPPLQVVPEVHAAEVPHLQTPEVESQLSPLPQPVIVQEAVEPQTPLRQNWPPLQTALEPHLQSPLFVSQLPVDWLQLPPKRQSWTQLVPEQICPC